MGKSSFFLAALILTLAGCSFGRTPEQRFLEAQNACDAYGFKRGTDAYSRCVMELDTAFARDDYEHQQAVSQRLIDYANRNRSVTCDTYGTVYSSRTTCR